MRWLITGGCGFIGRNLIAHLLADGDHEIRVLDNLTVGQGSQLESVAPVVERSPAELGRAAPPDVIELVVADVLDAGAVQMAALDRDVIVHLAASTGVAPSVRFPTRDCQINVMGAVNCLEAARHADVNRFIFASSGAPLGDVEPPIDEQKPPRPVSPYGASKLAGEGYCSAYWHSFGIETVALRFANVYGPGSDHKSSVVASFIRRALAGQPLEIYGDGHQTRDFIYIEDLVHAILLSSSARGIGGHLFQIASARETTIAELAATLVAVLGETGVTGVRIGHASPRVGDVLRTYADTSKAERLLGWQAAVPLEEGLRRAVRWFQSRESTLDRKGAEAHAPA